MPKIKDGRKTNWFMVENDLIDREDLTSYEKLIYMVLVRYSNGNEDCFPSYETIAKKAGVSRRTTIDIVKSLVRKKLLKKKTRKLKNKKENATNLYTLETASLGSAGDAPPSAGDAPPSAGDAPRKRTTKKDLPKNKKATSNVTYGNFEQRQYGDDYYNSCYIDFNKKEP